jgi:hypothetical protein
MADLKISQLPVATVPLAGTEVLPIVQSGTTKQATVDNVIASRASLGANTFTAAQEWATGTAIASATTINLNAATGNRVHITGTTTITTVTLTRGPRTLIFDGALTLTHNSTTNNLPGGVNITTAAGDRAIYESDGTTVYCVSYIKASGLPVKSSAGFTLGTTVATTSGTAIDFTGIPAGTTQILVNFNQVSTDNTTDMLIQLGDSGGIETSGYLGTGFYMENAGTARVVDGTTGFRICHAGNNQKHSGTLTISLQDSPAFKWVASGAIADTFSTAMGVTAGNKSLSAELTQLRLTTVSGAQNFDFGEVNIAYI